MTVTATQIWAKGTLVACALLLTTTNVLADDFPSRPLRVLVPYAAGGPADTGTRLAAEPLSRELGKPVVIENRGGGGGLNATEAFFKTEPDGYTILVGSIGPLTIIPAFKPVGYDVEKDVVRCRQYGAPPRCSRCGPLSASRPWPNSSLTRRPIPRRSPSARPASAR